MELKFKIENVGGIKNLEKTFDFSTNTTKLIYAPNGTGKTSFSKAIVKFINEKEKKSFGENQITKEKIDIIIENNKEKAMNITVFDSFENYKLKYGEEIFEASQKKENELLKQISDLESIIDKNKRLKRIKDLYNLSLNEKESLKSKNENLTKTLSFSIAENIINVYREEEEEMLNENLHKFLDKNLEKLFSSKVLLKIISKFNEILNITNTKKNYKKEKTNLPTEYSLDTLYETNGFLQDNKDLITKMMLASSEDNAILIKIIDKINKFHLNEFSKLSFFKVDFKLKNKTEEAFSSVLEELTEYIEIKNVEDYLKIKDFAIMSIIKQEDELIIKEIEEKIKNCKKLMPDIKEQEIEWEEVKSVYESVFNTKVIFKLEKEKNKTTGEDSYFVYLSHCFQKEEKITEKILRENLSESELRQLYIFDIMHKLNHMIKNKNENETKIVIFDDIVDSFDQRNITALISYFKYFETLKTNIKFIFLTHNYTFFSQMKKKIYSSESFIMRKNSKENYITETNIDDYIFSRWTDPSVIKMKKNTNNRNLTISKRISIKGLQI